MTPAPNTAGFTEYHYEKHYVFHGDLCGELSGQFISEMYNAGDYLTVAESGMEHACGALQNASDVNGEFFCPVYDCDEKFPNLAACASHVALMTAAENTVGYYADGLHRGETTGVSLGVRLEDHHKCATCHEDVKMGNVAGSNSFECSLCGHYLHDNQECPHQPPTTYLHTKIADLCRDERQFERVCVSPAWFTSRTLLWPEITMCLKMLAHTSSKQIGLTS